MGRDMMLDLEEKLAEEDTHGGLLEVFKGKRMMYRILLGVGIQAFQQLTGANYFFYYGTTIFSSIGIDNSFITQIILGLRQCRLHLPWSLHGREIRSSQMSHYRCPLDVHVLPHLCAALLIYFFLIESNGKSLEEIDTMYLMHVPPRKSTGWNLPEDIVAANAAAREQGQRDRGLRERKHNLANGGEKNEVENAGNGSTGLFEGNRA